MPILQRVGQRDISIRHQFTKRKFHVNLFMHRGYWYHGRSREKETVAAMQRLIQPGQTVIDVGAHIGYFSCLFAKLVGDKGTVYVFEPGSNNLPYLYKNVAQYPNVHVVEKAASDSCGSRSFYMENLTGQNNSLVKDYSIFQNNRENAFTGAATETSEVVVSVVRLDKFILDNALNLDFLKVDVEGGEYEVLLGLGDCLSDTGPVLMVEISRQHEEISALTTKKGYLVYDHKLNKVSELNANINVANYFFVPARLEQQFIERLKLGNNT